MSNKHLLLVLSFCLINLRISKAQEIYPKYSWNTITNSEQLGWSTEKLNEAKMIADSIGSDAVLIIYRGAILKAWGAIERKFMCHSIRKSLLSALIGVHVDNGDIDITQTLSKLNLNDFPNRLTTEEKSATIENLLSSRSGIYLPAAYEFPTRKPKRGKFKPGENWFYPNNWDYNALLTIYEKETGKKIFEDFHATFAAPLSMEDYEISDGYYHYERHKSAHPAYPFRMSARDLARFGLLFLRKGKWEEKQIISKSWVEKSTSPISQTYNEREAYGLLWWVDKKNFKYSYYSAEGSGGHGVIIVPELELVIVHRVNTFIGKRVSNRQRRKLISKIMESYVDGETETKLLLSEYSSQKEDLPLPEMKGFDKQVYEGIYKIEKLNDYESDTVSVKTNKDNQLEVFIPYKGYFSLKPINKNLFLLEDSNEYITFLTDKNGSPEKVIYHQNSRIGDKMVSSY